MPRYFFHIEDGVTPHDDEGTELRDIDAAKCEAARYCGRMICDDAATFWNRKELILTVTDEAGLVLFSLQFVGIEAPATQRVYPKVSA